MKKLRGTKVQGDGVPGQQTEELKNNHLREIMCIDEKKSFFSFICCFLIDEIVSQIAEYPGTKYNFVLGNGVLTKNINMSSKKVVHKF